MDLDLPITHKSCPNCGSTTRIVEAITEDLKEKGVLPLGFGSGAPDYARGIGQIIPLIDPNHLPVIMGPTMTAKAIEIFMDFCECGTMYATHASVVEVPLQMQQQPNRATRRSNGPNPHNFM